jgi:hypothetical protein
MAISGKVRGLFGADHQRRRAGSCGFLITYWASHTLGEGREACVGSSTIAVPTLGLSFGVTTSPAGERYNEIRHGLLRYQLAPRAAQPDGIGGNNSERIGESRL